MNKADRLSEYWMTAEQFMDWPGDGTGRSYQLVDGELQAMAPPSQTHARLQARLVYYLTSHLRAQRPQCEALIGPGVRPRPDMAHNVRVPDIAVTCSPSAARFMDQPVFIAEILSPSNTRETRDAVRAYLAIPSLREVLVLGSEAITAEVLLRGADGDWPMEPTEFGPGDTLVLASLGFELAMSELYEGLGLA